MEYPDIIYTKEGRIATITLNRPERMNAFSAAMIDSIQRALQDASTDDEIRVIVLTGAGRGFCAGFDLKQSSDPGGSSPDQAMARGPQMPLMFASIDKPIIGCINGPAIGWGLDLALLCDVRLAADNARFADPHLNFGIIDDNGGAYYLPRLLGWAKACELAFTGQPIDGKEAEKIGLVNRAVPLEQLETVTHEMADTMANQPPMALQLTKRAMRSGLVSDLKMSQDYVVVLLRQLVGSRGLAEMMKSGREKQTQ